MTRSLTRLICLRVLGMSFSDGAESSNAEALILESRATDLGVCEIDFDLTASCHSQIMVQVEISINSHGPKVPLQKL